MQAALLCTFGLHLSNTLVFVYQQKCRCTLRYVPVCYVLFIHICLQISYCVGKNVFFFQVVQP